MACNNSCENTCQHRTSNNGYLIILVLYILLAILLGSCFCY